MCIESRPVRALWIEIYQTSLKMCFPPSRPVRALWIEISVAMMKWSRRNVEAREGLVD